MLDALSASDRLLLMKFLCAFAWTDLEVSDKERHFVRRLVELAKLGPDDAKQVEEWLEVAPAPSSVDPKLVPPQHRRLFVDSIRALVYADGKVDPDERESFDRLKAAFESLD
jgi:uncharacterized tellurite resistance protein B-like protein